jgi:hypothetical protein
MTAKNPNDSQPENVIGFPGHSRSDSQNTSDEYRSTGKCDEPKLKKVAKLIYSGREVIPFPRARRLTQDLTENLVIVEKSANSLGYNLQDLVFSLQKQTERIQDNSVKVIEQQLELDQKNLAKGIYCLFNIAKKHHPQAITGKITPEQKGDHIRYQKLINDIDYIRRFLVEQVHGSCAFFEQSPHSKAYLRRSLNYLDVLPRYCQELAARTQRNIFDKVPGTKSDDLEP